ncbi:MAG TPA: tetratricopeptide repeat protein [Verrucomicrobiae bacterium]|nr:tetratricopeptide repeat protein [Verrucomicrobiae bacterium]
MTKAVSVPLGFIFILAGALMLPAQTNSPADMAVSEAVLRQANTVVLRQKLVQAQDAAAHNDLGLASKLYEDAYQLVQNIGSGIDAESAQTISGLVSVRLELAREAQRQGDYREADTQVNRVLKVDPQNPAALAFKKQNDRLIAALRGKVPDDATLQQVPTIAADKTDANTLVRDGKLLYEMGKFEDAEAKLQQALKLDPMNEGAYYYMTLVKQAVDAREERMHTTDNQTRIVEVTKAWESPTRNSAQLPVPNPYATNDLVHTGPGREAIMSKLNRIRLDQVFYDGLPLSEVVRNLSEQAKVRDPDKVGINFLINPNADNSASVTTVTPTIGAGSPFGGAGAGGIPGAAGGGQQIDPTTGLPINAAPTTGGESVDINSVIVRINPPLSNVRMADALDAIVEVADHPIEYSISDYAVVFSAKGPRSPQLFSRTFKVDPNTFVQGLESVGSLVFVNNNSSGSSGSGGSSGGGGSSSGGGSGQNSSVGLLAIVNAAPGESGNRSSGTGGGGGGGGGGGAGGAGGQTGNGGLDFVTTTNNMVDVSTSARDFFTTLGVNLYPPKSIFFNDRLGLLFVRATMQDLDTIESAIQALNQVAPQVHIKSRFVQVEQDDNAGLGFDWYLGQFNIGNSVSAQGGSAPSLNVPGPGGTAVPFPGPTAANQIPSSQFDQQITAGLNNSALPAIGTLTGILTNPNFRVVLHALEQRQGVEELAEPEVTTTSGRQTEMRATEIITVITGFSFQQGTAATTTTAGTP